MSLQKCFEDWRYGCRGDMQYADTDRSQYTSGSVVFFLSFFLFSTPNLWVTKWISTKIGHIFTYDCCLKNLVPTPQAFAPRAGGKPFLGPTFNFDRTYLCNEHDINNRKETCQSIWTSLHVPQLWWTLVEIRLRTMASFCPPLNFRIERHCQP